MLTQTEEQYQQQSEIKTLIIGDSHANNGLNPVYFDRGFNYANQGESIVLSYFRLLTASNDHDIQNVILNVDPHTFSDFKGEEISRVSFFYWKDKLDWAELISYDHKRFTADTPLQATLFSHLSSTTDFAAYLLDNRKPAKLLLGHKIRKTTSSEKKLSIHAKDKTARHFKSQNILGKTTSLDYFDKIIQLTETKNIHLYLISMPLSNEYIKEASAYVDLETITLEQQELLNDCNHCTFIDYQNYFTRVSQKDYFVDSDHLNSTGSNIISHALAQLLEQDDVCDERFQQTCH